MNNTQVRLTTDIDNNHTNNYILVTVTTYRSFLDGDFKSYYSVGDGRDCEREYCLSDCVAGLNEAEEMHNKHCADINKALDAVNVEECEEVWDVIQRLRRNLMEIRRKR